MLSERFIHARVHGAQCEHETCQRSQNLSEDEKGGVGVSGQRRAAAVVELLLRDAGLCTTLARALLHC